MNKSNFLKTFLLALISLSLLNFTLSPKGNGKEIQLLESWMTGSFNSLEQSEADTSFLHINLEMVRIWEDREDAIWLYVEQAASWAMEKPYRQRVYRLEQIDKNIFESKVLSMNDPLRFAGDWKKDVPLEGLTPDALSEREGCAIILHYQGGVFEGSTLEKNCQSSLYGATYATSDVRIEKAKISSWDRGFDDNDEQVWGAVKGPYVFNKVNDN